jgi:DegV family protein with EDD domain
MTQRIAILTDSTSDLPAEIARDHDIQVIPLNAHFGDEALLDRVDIDSETFLQRLTTGRALPTTSQPSAGAFEERFREIARHADAIVCVLISSKLSGTYQSAAVAADAVKDVIHVELVDSLNSSLALGLMALRARELASEGLDPAAIGTRLRDETALYHLVFFAETLEYLHRGGRIGKAATMVGSLLQLKPLLRVEAGVVVPFERTRTRKKAIAGLEAFVASFAAIDTVSALHIDSPEDVRRLYDTVSSNAAREIVPIGQFGPVVATHVGPGALGVMVREPLP